MCKSTLLAQFARAYYSTTVSVFLSAANRLSLDPDLIRLDLTKQIHWILNSDVLVIPRYDPTALKLYHQELHGHARRHKLIYYFIVDGLEALGDAPRQALLQHLAELLPFGSRQFRFLFSGDLSYFKTLQTAPLDVKSYPMTQFSIEEAHVMFNDQGLTIDSIKDIRSLCGGIPGRMASILRSLKAGVPLAEIVDNMPATRPEFFDIEWKQVREDDHQTRRLLAVLVHDAKPHTLSLLAEILRLDPKTIEAQLRRLTFVAIDPDSQLIQLAPTGLRSFIALKPRGTLQNRPMRDTSKPANETESGQELLYLVGDRSGN